MPPPFNTPPKPSPRTYKPKLIDAILPPRSRPEPAVRSLKYPKLATFYGEEGKGEVSWQTYKYAVESLITEGLYSSEQILMGMRGSLRGKASDKMRRLGHGILVEDVIDKLDKDYGDAESKLSVMSKFYACKQDTKETVQSSATRLEDLFDQAVHLNCLRRSDTLLLKEKLHGGLLKDLRNLSVYHCDIAEDYDAFKFRLRQLESDANDSGSDVKGCKATVTVGTAEKSRLDKMEQLLEQLNTKMAQLQKEGEQRQSFKPFRSDRSRPQYQSEGSHCSYRPQRPTGAGTFQPTCYKCGRKGHMQRACPNATDTLICYKCHQAGHFRRNCPN